MKVDKDFVADWKSCFDSLTDVGDPESFKKVFRSLVEARLQGDYKTFLSRTVLLKILLDNLKKPEVNYLQKWSKLVLTEVLKDRKMTLEKLEEAFRKADEQSVKAKTAKKPARKRSLLAKSLPDGLEEVVIAYKDLKEYGYKYETVDAQTADLTCVVDGENFQVLSFTLAVKEGSTETPPVLVNFSIKTEDNKKIVRWKNVDEDTLPAFFSSVKKILEDAGYFNVKVKR